MRRDSLVTDVPPICNIGGRHRHRRPRWLVGLDGDIPGYTSLQMSSEGKRAPAGLAALQQALQ